MSSLSCEIERVESSGEPRRNSSTGYATPTRVAVVTRNLPPDAAAAARLLASRSASGLPARSTGPRLSALLHHVGKLMGQQALPGGRIHCRRIVRPGDVVANRKGSRPEYKSSRPHFWSAVKLHIHKTLAEAAFQRLPESGSKRLGRGRECLSHQKGLRFAGPLRRRNPRRRKCRRATGAPTTARAYAAEGRPQTRTWHSCAQRRASAASASNRAAARPSNAHGFAAGYS